ncbi:MAG: phosphatidylserine decarboxylase [Sulfurovaceae bacterium]|nr:phosphatidylserine decarboxylase [Sulfurovaceae bacterium]
MSNRPFTSLISQLFGKFATTEFSPAVQSLINKSYVYLMGLDMSRFDEPSSYLSLNKLFTRALKVPMNISADSSEVISPADSFITDFGKITDEKAYQIKGMSYSIERLLGEHYKDDIAVLKDGCYANFYLSPKDYHRYHIPLDMRIKSATHIPGALYPVNIPFLKIKQNLFIENERIILECEICDGKKMFMILVGALNVGSMTLSFDERVQTNIDSREINHYAYDNISMKKGDLLGWFEMGSTIVIFSEAETVYFAGNLQAGQKIAFGDIIGKVTC